MKIVRKIFYQTNSILLGPKSKRFSFQTYLKPVVDPGFPRRGGANRKGGEANLLFWPIFPRTCMKILKRWPQMEVNIPGALLYPPMVKLFCFIVSRCEQAFSKGYWSWKKRYSPDRNDIHHPWQFSVVRILDHRDQLMNNSTESNFNIAKREAVNLVIQEYSIFAN